MNTQTITWTALPNGTASVRGETRLRLSVFVSPRLQSDTASAPLSLFPDFLDWPETLFPTDDRREVIFRVQFGNGNPILATRVGARPQSDLWRALFTGNTPLEPYEFKNFKDRPIQSYPVKNIQDFIKKQYVALSATSAEDFPAADSLVRDPGAPFRPLAFTPRENKEERLTEDIMNQLSRSKFISRGSIADPEELARSFLQAKLFHKPFTEKRIQIPAPSIDFHRMVSLLGDYPHLLRLMGLVHDLEIPVPVRTASENTVQVFVTWMPGDASVSTSNIPSEIKKFATRCWVGADGFYALPRSINPELVNGMLPFENPRRYEVVRIDADGAAIKTLNFASNLAIARSLRKTDDTPETSSVPAMRSGGISVARVDMAEQTHKSFIRQDVINQSLNGNDGTVLDAEDITRGFSIDVRDSLTNKWHSLCRRIGTYEFSRPTPAIIEKVEDEGFVSQSLTSAADDSSEILRQGEYLFHWQGWSLAAPQPGKTIDADGKPVYPATELDPEFKLDVGFIPKPGSLPRLRFGAIYSLRARAVDLAGNRLSLGDKLLQEDLHVTPPLVYGRFEPVPPPVIVMRHRVTEGESVERMVIRSNYNKPVDQTAQRHIVPPKTSQTMAEEHGLFDDIETGQVDAEAYKIIVEKEDGTITGTADPYNHNQPYVDEDDLKVPYLPDVLSRGAALHGLPGVSGGLLVDFGYSPAVKWPDGLPFRLVLGEYESPKIDFNNSSRVLEVLLPKAEAIDVRLSSFMEKNGVMLMGLVQWMIESGQDETPAINLATMGKHWMLTPYRIITMVHAVRQPLRTPEFDQFNLSRFVGQTFVTLYDRVMRVSRKSTVKLDIEASWNETVDPAGEAGPRVIAGKARPFELPVALAADPAEEEIVYLEGRHEFGDTKYRQVIYSAIATTRFAEYFTQRNRSVKLAGTSPFTLSSEGIVPGSEAVRRADGTATYKIYDEAHKTGDYVMDYVNGTIRRASNTGKIPENVNLEVSYLTPPITREMTQPRTMDVLSSARPAAPKVLYVIPAFRWQAPPQGIDSDTILSRRVGGGIRIYMERTWFSSGDGELLGVVLWPGPDNISLSTQAAHEKIKPYVTQWGNDPLFQSGPVDILPAQAAFKLSKTVHQASGLMLEEVPDPNLKVNIAGHEVSYDEERQLWCCDMDIDAGQSYFPFVRLALVRYQPKSLSRAVTGPDTYVDPGNDNVHLSSVVLADFIQLAPDRYASITRNGAKSLTYHVAVTGHSYRVLTGQAGPGRVEISLERRREDIDIEVSGELAWEPVETAAGLRIVVLDHKLEREGNTTWTGEITLPNNKDVFRLLIKEFELYNVPGMLPIVQRRLVYADAIPLRL